jgi:glycosyltransferase involved in cell wall biosynthesis
MKISVVMQVYLEDYLYARKDPVKKFIRAIHSFLNQTYKNKELIIVADGCSIASEVFYSNFSTNKEIKLIFLHENKQDKMYNLIDEKTFFRGLPKRLGCSLAKGDLISYMDSDDVILPSHLENLHNVWEDKFHNMMWSCNSTRLMPREATTLKEFEICYPNWDKEFDLKEYGVNSKFFPLTIDEKFFLTSTCSLVHKNNIGCYWQDCTGRHEDFDFFKQMETKYPNQGFAFSEIGYAVCHFKNEWDY